MQNTQKISASETAKGNTRSEILAAHAEFLALPNPPRGEDGDRDNYEYFYADKLMQEADALEALESKWIHKKVCHLELPNDGVMVPVETAKALLVNTRLYVRDSSGGNSYGYSYAVCLGKIDWPLIESTTVDVPGGFTNQFSLSQLETIIKAVAESAKELPRLTVK
jgi:hypothetical protein